MGEEGIGAGDGCNDVGGVGDVLGLSDISLEDGESAIGDSLGGEEEASMSGSVGLSPDDGLGCNDGALLGMSLLSDKRGVGASVGKSSPNCRKRCFWASFMGSS